jgi:hypothetical protein
VQNVEHAVGEYQRPRQLREARRELCGRAELGFEGGSGMHAASVTPLPATLQMRREWQVTPFVKQRQDRRQRAGACDKRPLAQFSQWLRSSRKLVVQTQFPKEDYA